MSEALPSAGPRWRRAGDLMENSIKLPSTDSNFAKKPDVPTTSSWFTPLGAGESRWSRRSAAYTNVIGGIAKELSHIADVASFTLTHSSRA